MGFGVLEPRDRDAVVPGTSLLTDDPLAGLGVAGAAIDVTL
jgi:hypothetical protein